MTDKSICMGCAEMIRIKVRSIATDYDAEMETCSVDGIRNLLEVNDTVKECSRFVGMKKKERKAGYGDRPTIPRPIPKSRPEK